MKAPLEKSDRYRGDMSPRIEWFGELENCVIISLDRPEKRNAVDMPALLRMQEYLAEAQQRSCRVLILRGEGSAFCSGADLEGVELGEFTETLSAVLRALVGFPGLTVALIDGPALGAGMQLAAACDLRAATAKSAIGIPAVKLGLAVDFWTVERIGQEAGWNVARRILLTGESIPAEELHGRFIHRIVGDDRALDDAREWVGGLSLLAPLSVRAHKLAINAAVDSSSIAETAVSGAMIHDLVEQARLAAWASSDALEGRRAFREKRPPHFTGE